MYECTIMSRGYEVTARGVIPPAVFARYLEHVRWQAFLYGPTAMRAITSQARRAVIRAQRFELHEDIAHHVPLRFSSWIARVGRSSVDFAHRIWRDPEVEGGTRRQIGLAAATIVALGSDGMPAALPDAVRGAVVEDVVPAALPLDERLPPGCWERALQIRPSDLDLLQHVNQSNYLNFFDDARLWAAAEGGYGERSQAATGQIRGVALDHRQELRLDQKVKLRTWRSEQSPAQPEHLVLGFALEACESGALLCQGRMDVACGR